MAQPVNQLLEKRMSRKQFLANVGATVITLVGISAVLKGFGLQHTDSSGYGSSPYGGKTAGHK